MARTERGVPRWAVASLLGVGPAAVVAHLPGTWPALAIASGALPVAAGVFVLGGDRKYYSAAGSAYCVVLGLAGVAPAGDWEGPAIVLLALGLPSALLVAAIYGGERLLERAVDDGETTAASTLSRALTAVTAFRLARSAFAIGRTAAYVGVVLFVGTATFALDGLGVTAPVGIPGLGRVDAVLLGFVAAVLVGFHGLAVAHTTWLAARDVVDSGREARRRFAGRGSTADGDRAEPPVDRSDDAERE